MTETVPVSLFRYRPLDSSLFERELDALRNSYLYAPSFSSMNDPMEAFYRFDTRFDPLLNGMVPGITDVVQTQISESIKNFGLVSFSETPHHLLLWGYYASGFKGMCLEFDRERLEQISRFKTEPLRKVRYLGTAYRPLLTAEALRTDKFLDTAIEFLSQKRTEWQHEKEWRFLCGQVGKRYYVDDALKSIYLGPSTLPEHRSSICEAMQSRPVDIYAGIVDGYELRFDKVQSAPTYEQCERTIEVEGEIDQLDLDRTEITDFLTVPVGGLYNICKDLLRHPNIAYISSVHLSGEQLDRLVVCTSYRLRDKVSCYNNYFFDAELRPILNGDITSAQS